MCKPFIQWLQEHHIPQRMTHYDMRDMSYAHNRINGERFPWADVKWQPDVLKRWRVLYEQLTRGMKSLSYNDL